LNDILSIRKYWQPFTDSRIQKYTQNRHSNHSGRKLPIPPLPLRRCGPHLIHPSLDRPHSPSQTASRHPWDRPTDRQTDGLGDRSVPRPPYALYINYINAANNSNPFKIYCRSFSSRGAVARRCRLCSSSIGFHQT